MERKISALLFSDVAGYSKLRESQLRVFIERALPDVAALLDKHRNDFLELNTWGDAIVVASLDPYSVARFALALRDFYRNRNWADDHLPDDLSCRIALHAGVIFTDHDPIRRSNGIVGTQVNLAARIEPITTPGEVWVTDQFMALIDPATDSKLAFDDLGERPLAKKFGSRRLWRLRRSHESAEQPRDIQIQPVEITMAAVERADFGTWAKFLSSIPEREEAAELTTLLYKRSIFDQDLQGMATFSQGQACPAACLLVDVDNFKSFNDLYSYQKGDEALSLVALQISQIVQGRGRGYRYGGGEFVVLLPNTGLGEATAFGERLRSRVAQVRVPGVDIALTVSVGVSSYPDPAPTVNDLFSQAGSAVRVAKRRGKNQVRAFGVRRLSEVEAQTFAEWDAAFVAYRRDHLKPFAESATEAYPRFRGAASHLPEIWEEATHSAKWPRDLPMPGNPPLRLWRVQFGVGLDAEDENLFKFAESIYPPFNPLDARPLRERSILTPSEFDVFDKARGGLADYFSLCGDLMRQTPAFADFLEEKVRKNHYYKVKIVAYLDLALVRAIGDRAETGPGKLGLFHLGALWKGDDPRK